MDGTAHIVVLIPACRPGNALLTFTRELAAENYRATVIVDGFLDRIMREFEPREYHLIDTHQHGLDLRATVRERGRILYATALWPLVFTQHLVLARKNGDS